MGRAIAKGLIDSYAIHAKDLILADRHLRGLASLEKKGAILAKDNIKACDNAGIIILAVKPQILPEVLAEINDTVHAKKLIISVIAGASIKEIQKGLNKDQPIIRAMPNLGAEVLESMTGWAVSKEVNTSHLIYAKKIFTSIGLDIKLKKEDEIDKITAISGAGPAYFLYLAELLEAQAIKLGFREQDARGLARQTLIATAKVLDEAGQKVKEMREKVTSKGGITEAALEELKNPEFKKIFGNAIQAALRRAEEIGK